MAIRTDEETGLVTCALQVENFRVQGLLIVQSPDLILGRGEPNRDDERVRNGPLSDASPEHVPILTF